MARASAEERRRRKASDEAAYARGRLTATGYNQGVEEDAVCRDNKGRVGGQLTVSFALVAALAALRETSQMPCRELRGHLEELTHGRRTLSASQLCRRISAMGIRAFRGGLLVGGFEASFRRRDGRTVITVRRARRGGRAEQETAIEHVGDRMAAVTAGPGRRPEPGAVIDATFLSTGNRSAGRLEKWGREVGRRDNHKLTACSGTRTNRTVAAVLTDDRTGDGAAFGPVVGALKESGALQGVDGEGPPIHGDGAHGLRKNFAIARRAGCRLLAPIRVNDSGRSRGTAGWHAEFMWQLAGVRGAAARGVDADKISRRERLAHREDWKEEVGQSVRSRAEYLFSAFKRLFGGHVAARKWENVVKEVARKIAIYNAILEAAGGA